MLDNLCLFNSSEDRLQYPDLGMFFLDCGAYSVLTGVWQTLPVDEYLKFVLKYHNKIELFVGPDVIGSAEKTFTHLKYFVKHLQCHDEWEFLVGKILLTYHLVDKDLDTLSEMTEWAYAAGIRWLAIGGLVVPGVSNASKLAALEVVLNRVYNELKLPFKLHLFGGTNMDFVQCFRPDSVDSASYLKKSQVLSLIRFDSVSGETYTLNTKGYTNTEQVNLIVRILSDYDLSVDREGFKRELLKAPPAVRCMLSNLVVISGVEAYMRDQIQKPHFKYWVSLASASFVSVANRHGWLIAEVYYKFWKDRCLFSYVDLYNEDESVPQEWLRTFFK